MATEDVFGIVGTTQAGNFHVERAVAEGGFGVVYRAQHAGFRAPVAIKCLKIPEELTQRQREVFLEKFREEAELLFRLSAAIPEVVRPLHIDALHLKGGGFVPFMAMEWLEGESLDAIITKRADQGQAPLGVHKLLKMLRPVAHALCRAHRFPGPRGIESIVHRDLKPENIFIAIIGDRESIKILDFGIAKARRVASEAAGRLTGQSIEEDEASSFTPAYGSPEQWAPKRFGATGPWTDVWGLALTMVEVLVGGPAIDGDTYAMRRLSLDEKRRPTPRALGAVVSDEVEQAFERALAVDPRRRTRDVETFWTELERAMSLSLSFSKRDPRREDEGSVRAAEAIAGPAVQPVVPMATPEAARLARIDLTRAPRKGGPASAAERELSALSRGPESTDFSDVFAPSERPPKAAPVSEKVPSSRRDAAPRPMDPLEFDLDAPPSFGWQGQPARADEDPAWPPQEPEENADLEPAAPLSPDERPRSSRRGALDLELSLPTELSPGSGIRAGRGPSSDRAFAPRPRPLDDTLESAFDVAPILDRRPPPRPEAAPLDVEPRPLRRDSHRNLPPFARSEPNAELRKLSARIRGPLAVLSLALVISLGEIAYTRITETPLMLGPVRPFWLAAPIALIGVAFTLWRFIGDRDDG